MEKMKFRGHETFFIRKGWLNKGMRYIQKDPYVFMGTNGNSSDILGIGTNMVKSLRYWLQVVGVTKENISGKRFQELTEIGKIIYENDPYIEVLGTLAILHYFLVTNKEMATAWYFFFNIFKNIEFTKDDFISQLKNYIKVNSDIEISERTIEDDYNCILNTYLPRIKTSVIKINPESNIDCPLGELNLLDVVDKKEKIYKKIPINFEKLNPLIVLSIISKEYTAKKEIKIIDLLLNEKSIGKIFNLDMVNLIKILYVLERMGYLKVIRTAGLDIIRLEKEVNFYMIIKKYYDSINI